MANLLIIDDDPNAIRQLTDLVKGFGHRVESSIYPDSLLDILDAQPVDLLLLDVYMPEVDGLTLLRRLKACQAHCRLPVVMLTADDDPALLARCFEAGAADFVAKPVNQTILRVRLESALNARRNLDRLEQVNRQLKSVFDSLAAGAVTVDANYKIRHISASGLAMLDIDEADALGKPAAALLGAPIAGPAGVLTEYGRAPFRERQTQILSPSGAVIPVVLSIAPLDPEVAGASWLLTFRDRRAEERALREGHRGVHFGRMISNDNGMRQVFKLIEKAAASEANVLIHGESGTGKELAARELHDRSRRAQRPFHAVNCGAIPENLMESEFFGHERGAFTGAVRGKPGHFELAHGGSLFLDEIGELPLAMQVKLLRALQERTVRRVGGVRDIAVDVRVIAASLRDLSAMCAEGRFREDLYYRLDVVSLELPPLRERLQDAPLLAEAFIRDRNRRERRAVKGLTAEALQALMSHDWPGNVRELYNAIERAFAVSEGDVLTRAHLPARIARAAEPAETANQAAAPRAPRDEKQAIQHALEQANFNKGRAAAMLGVSPATLYRKRKKFGI